MTGLAPEIRRSEVPSIHGLPLFNPFPGLRAFGQDEADLFFGRETHIEELLQRLASKRFVAVVGTSGSGKSSLVLAGILPRLDGGFRTPHGSFWRIARMRPGDDPIGNLASALSRAEIFKNTELSKELGDTDAIHLALTEVGLSRSQLGLIRAARESNLGKRENLLVIVDQFEEIFRYRALRRNERRDTATAFVNLLLEAARQDDVPIYVLITMRSDFLGECVQFRGLPEAINHGQYLIPLLNRKQRQSAIEGPVGVAGAKVSSTLLQRLLNDAGNMTDQLPVLQHALMRTFTFWMDRQNPNSPIDLEDYEAAGGTDSALANHADEACRELDDDEYRVAQIMFQCLTDRSSDGRWIRRPCRVSEILDVAETDINTLNTVITCFTSDSRSFLTLHPQSDTLTPDTLVDLSHESLMRLWKKLQNWSELEIRSAEQLQLLSDAAARYAAGKGGLWSDPELALALKWQEERHPNEVWSKRFGVDYEQVRQFIQKSREVRDLRAADLERDRRARLEQARALAELEQKKAEAERAKAETERKNSERLRRYAQALRRWIVAVVVLAVIAVLVAFWAVTQQFAANRARLEAEGQRIRAENERSESERARLYAEKMERLASESEKDARRAAELAEEAKKKAEEEKQNAEAARLIAENERDNATRAKARAIVSSREALKQKKNAEEATKEAQRAREMAERLAEEKIERAKKAELEKYKLELRDEIPEW